MRPWPGESFAPGLFAALLSPLVHLTVVKLAPYVRGHTRLRAYRIDQP